MLQALANGDKVVIRPGVRRRASFWPSLRDWLRDRIFSPLSQVLSRRSPMEIFFICLLGAMFVGVCEYLDRLRLSMVLLHIIPIAVAGLVWRRACRLPARFLRRADLVGRHPFQGR